MGINWDLYNKRLNVNGKTKRERDLYNLKNDLSNELTDSLSCKDVIINGNARKIEFVKGTKGSIKTIHSLPNETFECGDYIVYSNQTYLVSDIDEDREVYTTGTMQQCNYTIKFQSSDGTILYYPIIAETNSTIGIDVNTVLTVPNSVFTIKVPFDVYTSTCLVENKRIFIDKTTEKPRSYKITKVNNTEYNYGDKGLIVLTLEQTVGDYPKDRVDLGICDYEEPTTTPTLPPVGNYSMSISASGSLIIGGNSRTFIPKLVDSNGVEQTFVGVWTFNYNGMPTSDFTITYSGNNCVVKVAEDFDIIDNVLVLTCTSDDGLYSASYSATITAM